jgi:hypothetical protein
MHYQLLALDIDGTLVGRDQVVAEDVLAALSAAQAGGLRVCLATGRSVAESLPVWRQLPRTGPAEPMIVVGGAQVSEPDTGRTLYQKAMPRAVAQEFAEALGEQNLAAMALVDGWRHPFDYYVTEAGDMAGAWRDWFSKMRVRIRKVRRLDEADGLAEILRISTVLERSAAARLSEELRPRFADRLNVHAILAPNYGVTVIEAHAAGATKLTALKYVAQGMGVAMARVAAAGDDVNDIPMVGGAGLGAAMASAPPSLRDVARHTVEDGLAGFIRRLAAGEFDPR